MESGGVPENPKDKGSNPREYQRTLRTRNGIQASTRESGGLWMESRRVPENPKDYEWNLGEY